MLEQVLVGQEQAQRPDQYLPVHIVTKHQQLRQHAAHTSLQCNKVFQTAHALRLHGKAEYAWAMYYEAVFLADAGNDLFQRAIAESQPAANDDKAGT